MTARLKDLATRLLPAGDGLSHARGGLLHRALLWALWLHVPSMLVVGMATGQDLWLVFLEAGLLALGAAAASSKVFSRRMRTLLAVVTLLSFSAWLVHVTGGLAESHLHFFAVLAFILLFQDWVPVTAALAYAAVHYGILGVFFPAEIYSSEAARDRPIVWAFIYAGFMVIAALAGLAAWRLAGAERRIVGRMLDAVGAGIYGIDEAGRITFVNSVLCGMVGKERKELEGADHHLALGHQSAAGGPVEAGDCRLCAAVSGAEGITGETYLGGSGETAAVPVEYVTRPAGSGGRDLGSVITVRDLRERHAWEALRRQTEAERDQLASIAEASPDLALIGRSDGQMVWMNAAGRKMLGFGPSEDMAGYRIEDLFSPVEMARIYAEDMPVLAREGSWQGEWTLQARDAAQIPVLVTQHVHHDGTGGDTYVSGTMRDLRPQREEERRLRESEQRLSAAELVAGMGSWEWDPVSDEVRSSPGLVHLLGLEPGSDEKGVDSWLSLMHPDDLQMALDRTEEARSAGTPVDVIYRMVRTDGRQLSVHCRGEMVAHEQGPGMSMLGTLLDVTDRHAASEALRKSEELLRSVIATAGDAYVQFDGDGRVTEWNAQAEATFGRTRAEALGRPLSSLVLVAGTRELFERRVGLCDESGEGLSPHGRFELSMVHSSGHEIPVEVTAWAIRTGDATVFNCFIRDISERQAAERAKDEFLSVVGHELRTPLTSIHGALGLLRAGLLGELNDRGQQMVGIAAHNTDRLVRLINDILDIERLNSGKVLLERQECDIAALGQRSVEAMRPMAEAAGVRLEIDAQAGTAWVDSDRIEQTLTNLLSNAIKFSPAGAAVWLVARTGGDELEVQVRDQGRGIPTEHLELVFDRFQQVDGSDAREKGGTGLGLAICRTIVQQHGGRIWAESGSGGGAVLTLRLPVIPPYDGPVTEGGPTVLICGNDASRRDTVAAMLTPHGYATINVPSAAGLLEAAITHRPALILLELRMPTMDGWQAAAELRDQRETRNIPMVFLSLDGDEETTGHRAAAGPDNPIGPDGLFDAIEGAIGSRAAGPTLLLVEDDEGLAQVLTERFRCLGIEVHHAPTAQRALAMCAHIVPDLLILDLLLPDQDGYAVVAQLRRDARLRGMPLAVYTACDLSEADRMRLRLGQTEFFTKGRVSPDEFERHVVDLFGHLTSTEGEPTYA